MRTLRMTGRRPAVLALGVALVATACQPDGGDDGPAAAPDEIAAVDDGDAVDDDEAARYEPGPLSRLMGADIDQDAIEEEFRVQRRAVEELITACMADEGFPYEPRLLEPNPPGPWVDLPPDEFAAEYGFGISTLEQADRRSGSNDPNDELVAGMSEAERDAWSIALHGAAPDEDGNLDRSFEPGEDGCAGAASREVFGDGDDAFDQESWEPLIDEINGLYDAIQRDPRLVAAEEAWAACLADAGHPGYSMDGESAPTVQDAVNERLQAIAPESTDGDEDDEAGGRAGLGPASELGAPPALDLSAFDPEELAEVQAFEIELAVAEAACRAPYREVEQEVTFELEQEFVDANRADLEAYRDAMADSGGVG